VLKNIVLQQFFKVYLSDATAYMRLIETDKNCTHCQWKCDIYFTAREMGLQHELKPVQMVYKKHETICQQDAPITHAINIKTGNAKMFVNGLFGKQIILGILMPANYTGLTAIFGSPDYQYSVTALTHCQTCQVDINMVKSMYHANPDFQQMLNQSFSKTLTSIMKKLVSLNQKQIRAKVAESLIYLAQLHESDQFVLTLSRKELGELSAITSENAVRVLSEFRKEGLISVAGKELSLLQKEVLVKISDAG
jgi:CRP/FNR family transcriptional regulator, polysaccharide utilization system transcription regulator